MKKITLSFLCVLAFRMDSISQSPVADSSQYPPVPKEVNTDEVVFTKVEQEAQFTGGLPAWSEYISDKLSSFDPGKKGAPKGKYRVIVRFVVSRKGSISYVTAQTNHGYGMEEAVVKAIKASPAWVPARQNGRPVNAYREQPVTFTVE